MTATSIGSATVTLTVAVGGSTWTDTVSVTVVNKELVDYVINKDGAPLIGSLDLAYTNILTFSYIPWDATVNSIGILVDDPTVATATIDKDSKTITVVPKSLGNTTVTVDIDGKIKSFSVNVTLVPTVVPVTAIDITHNGESVSFVDIYGTKELQLHVYPVNATNQDAIVTVGDSGIISASIDNTTKTITVNQISVGETTLTVTVGDQTKTVSVNSTGATLKDFNIVKGEDVIALDWISGTTIYDVVFIPEDAPNTPIIAFTSNSTIATATVDSETRRVTVTPITDGNVTLTVRAGTISKEINLTVSGLRVSVINIKDGSANVGSIAFTGTKTLSVEVLPVTALSKNFTASVGNPSIASVSVNNTNRTVTLTSVANFGDTTLTVYADGKSTTISVKVLSVDVESIDIRNGSTSITTDNINTQKSYNVVISPGNATYTQESISISEYDADIITPTFDTGTKQLTVVPHKIGSTPLTLNIGGKSRILTVNVSSILATSLDIRSGGTSVSSDSIHSAKIYQVVTSPAATTNTAMTATSSNTGVATVSVSGSNFTVTPVNNGTSTITVRNTASGVTRTLNITVAGYRVQTVNIKDGTTNVTAIAITGVKTLNVEILPSTAANTTISAVSTNTSVVTVIADNTNKRITLTPVALGTSTVNVTVDGITRALTVNVNDIHATSIDIRSGGASITSDSITTSKTYSVVSSPLNTTNTAMTVTSSNVGVATVSVSGTNFTVNPITNGTTTITARNTASGVTKTLNIAVVGLRVENINIKDGTTTVTSVSITGSKTFNVEVLPATAPNNTISATTSNGAVATVSTNNTNKTITINPVAAGTAIVSVSADGFVRQLTVNVTAILATSLDIRSGTTSITSDTITSAKTYSVVTTPPGTTNTAMTATSSNTGVATVSVSGSNFTVTPVTDGTSTITVRNTASGVTKTLSITVTGLRVQTVNLKDGTTTVTSISTSSAKTLNVEILPATALNKTITASSANTSIATVSVDNTNKRITVTPVAAGTTTVTVTVDGVSRALTVTVPTILPTSISITGSNSVLIGARALSATVGPSNATNKGVTWSTSNSSRVSISSTSGSSITITAVGNGSATITARAAGNTSVLATITINADVGQPVSSLAVGSRVSDGGSVNLLLSKSAHYGTGRSKSTGYSGSVSYYYSWITESGFTLNTWSSTEEAVYSMSTRGRDLYNARHPSDTFNSRLVGVTIPITNIRDNPPVTATWMTPMFLPSLTELGGTPAWVEGRIFPAFSTTAYNPGTDI